MREACDYIEMVAPSPAAAVQRGLAAVKSVSVKMHPGSPGVPSGEERSEPAAQPVEPHYAEDKAEELALAVRALQTEVETAYRCAATAGAPPTITIEFEKPAADCMEVALRCHRLHGPNCWRVHDQQTGPSKPKSLRTVW